VATPRTTRRRPKPWPRDPCDSTRSSTGTTIISGSPAEASAIEPRQEQLLGTSQVVARGDLDERLGAGAGAGARERGECGERELGVARSSLRSIASRLPTESRSAGSCPVQAQAAPGKCPARPRAAPTGARRPARGSSQHSISPPAPAVDGCTHDLWEVIEGSKERTATRRTDVRIRRRGQATGTPPVGRRAGPLIRPQPAWPSSI
jgi:hypothetical protein